MTKPEKPYNLEQRTLVFAKGIIALCKEISRDIVNMKIVGQLIDASGSVGANYREANEAVSKRDFAHRMKITRKECKESTYWLELLMAANPGFKEKIADFIKESEELRNIFTAIIDKTGTK